MLSNFFMITTRWIFYISIILWIIVTIKGIYHRRKIPVGKNSKDLKLPNIDIIIPLKRGTLPFEYKKQISKLNGVDSVFIADDEEMQDWIASNETSNSGGCYNDKIIRQHRGFNQINDKENLVFFSDADIRLEQSIIDEARHLFANNTQLGLLFFPYNQLPETKNVYSYFHAYFFNIHAIPVIEWFKIFGNIPGALGGAMVLRIKDVQKHIDWNTLRYYLTEDIPMAQMISKAGLKVLCAKQSVSCYVPQLSRNEFEHIWNRWFMCIRYYIPTTFYGIVFWMSCLYAAGPFILIHDFFDQQYLLTNLILCILWYITIWFGFKRFQIWYHPLLLLTTIIHPLIFVKPLLCSLVSKRVVWQGTTIEITGRGYLK
jgi:cellulose synthase/poly-beta-1,6-N-acetylglucosamine synthase-like glycosyltransferase